jgi:hypothetical protein
MRGMIRSFTIVSLAAILAGCASPAFLGERSQVVTEAGSTFRVYMRSGSGEVEAHRVSPELLPSRSLVLAKAEQAIAIATGCDIIPGTMEGDQAIIKAEVDCVLP